MHKVLSLLALSLLVSACGRDLLDPGEVNPTPRPVAEATGAKQILFGDLHTHTTYSMDAFEQGMSILQGEGLHPPANACDFARYCSQLDFWSINDHAVSISPERWQATVDSIRACDAVAGNPENPDMVSLLGWEWTQIGATPDRHFGHKNVVLRELEDGKIPARPISAALGAEDQFNVTLDPVLVAKDVATRPFRDTENFSEHWDFVRFNIGSFSAPACDSGIATTELPIDCRESAATPADLFAKLDAWQGEYFVIPHGNSWGLYTPPGSSWNKQLLNGQTNDRQSLIEIYSGHGNAEEYRSWRSVAVDEAGQSYCPPPQDGYVACCWQAGEIIRQQCDNPESADCQNEVVSARNNFLSAGASGHLTLQGVSAEDWLNCGTCPDCFLPAYNHRPGSSAQAALATTEFENGEQRRFRFGFIASSDNHVARPGTGYKEYGRPYMTESQGPTKAWAEKLASSEATSDQIRSIDKNEVIASPRNVYNRERVNSFWYTGGLVAVHSEGRNREALWDGLDRREVYATSGPRILLWFDLVEGGSRLPMGSETNLADNPTFQVRAMGALEQLPGCPDSSVTALGEERSARLCHNECYNPGAKRQALARLEVIRIRPQQSPDEALGDLIEDPWKVFPCSAEQELCEASFVDEEYAAAGRDTVYYVRAVQEATPAVNGAGLRCEFDDQGNCIKVNPCHGDYRSDMADDCLADVEERAWSSPIFVDYPKTVSQ